LRGPNGGDAAEVAGDDSAEAAEGSSEANLNAIRGKRRECSEKRKKKETLFHIHRSKEREAANAQRSS
jgi:hypothetical protein